MLGQLPNLITLGRLLAVPVMVALVLEKNYLFAFWLFLAAGISDAVDGLIAKHFQLETEIGKFLDPIADKALLMTVYLALGSQDQVPVWLAIMIVSRDLMIVGGALLFQTMTQRLRMEPLWISKANTTFQISLVVVVLARAAYGFEVVWVTEALTWVVAATTILSGGAYIYTWGLRILSMEKDL